MTRRVPGALALVACVACVVNGCGDAAPPRSQPDLERTTLRLVERIGEARPPAGAAAVDTRSGLTAWTFDTPPDENAPDVWRGGPGTADVRQEGGRLVGRSVDAVPLLHVLCEPLARPDVLEAVELRMRVSAGTDMWFGGSTEPVDDLQWFREWWLTQTPIASPVVPGDELRTYRLVPPIALDSRVLRHVFLRPTDVADAEFEIESVRLVWRREHLASLAGSVSWQGLGQIFHESIVTRAPQTLEFDLRLPAEPRLHAALGLLTTGPARFRVVVTPRDARIPAVVHERTLSLGGVWEDLRLPLDELAGQFVTVGLGLESDEPEQLGLWGSPVVRSAAADEDADLPQGVILMMVDTLRADHLDLHGYARETAPNLTALAREGVHFDQCFSQATWTKASSASLLTSLYPTTHGVTDFGERLPASADTLAEAFRDAGHATLSLSSIMFTGEFSNLHQGFETVHEARSVPPARGSKTALPYVTRLADWLDDHRDEPFFVFLHVFDPHDPYVPQVPHDRRWGDDAARGSHPGRLEQLQPHIADPALRRIGMATRDELDAAGLSPEEYVAPLRDWYDGSIRAMDVEVGRLRETLRHLGLEQRTLLVVTSDHGEEFLDHGRMFHGQGVYAELNHVPLVVSWPGHVPAGLQVDEVVQGIDVMPTLLDLAGLPVPDRAQGRSLRPLFDPESGPPWRPRAAVTVKAATRRPVPPPGATEAYAWITGGWKLVHRVQGEPGQPEFELYDRRRDPGDTIDLADEHPDVVARLAADLLAWRAATLEAALPDDEESTSSLDSEELEHLRALGYVR